MKLLSIALMFAGAFSVNAQVIVPPEDYERLFKTCKAGGSNTYVALEYRSGKISTYNYDECYSYNVDNMDPLKSVVFCKTVTCYNYLTETCAGAASPSIGGLLLKGTALENPLNFMSWVGKGAVCVWSPL